MQYDNQIEEKFIKLQEAIKRLQDLKDQIRQYYVDMFTNMESGELFEVYDLEKEKFIGFPGKETNDVMNKFSIIDGLTEADYNGNSAINVEDLVVVRHDYKIDFENPIFVGMTDRFNIERDGSDKNKKSK